MSRRRLTLTIAADDVPRAEALLTLAGAETISLRDAADDAVLEPEPNTAPLWPNVTLEALFAMAADLTPLEALLATVFPGADAAVDLLLESAWQPGLKQIVKARPIGARLWLAPADEPNVPGDRAVVRLNMGLAFGTGRHATTALCLDWLERHVTPGITVLDYGCGSGILALAALALGAGRAFAIDNDPQALFATQANASLNDAAARLFVGAPDELPAVEADVLAANILAGPLVALAPVLAQHVRVRGWFVLSGVLEAQAALVAAAYAPYCDTVEQAARDGWVCLTARRNPG